MVGGADDSSSITYNISLVAASGREQGVVLRIRRDGLWLYTEGGKEIQQLPYQHIVKWLPSKLRSKDPGPDDCLDVQVETTAGKKDLRMRCTDVATVSSVMSDIRSTVQAVMSNLDSSRPAAPSQATAAAAADQPQLENMQHQQPQQQHPADLQSRRHSKQRQQQQPEDHSKQTGEQQLLPQAQQPQAQQQRVPLQERRVQVLQQEQPTHSTPELQEPPLQQYSMKLAIPPHHTHQHKPLPNTPLLPATQQLLQDSLQGQPDHSTDDLQQQSQHLSKQQQQQQQRGAAATASLHASTSSSSWQHTSPGATAVLSRSVDTRGIAGSSSPTAGPVSPLRHSLPKAASARASPSLTTVQAALLNKETELDVPAVTTTAAAAGGLAGGLAVDLSKLGISLAAAQDWQKVGAATAAAGSSEAAAQMRFLEDLVKRLSEELAARLAAEGPQTAQGVLQAAAAAVPATGADLPLPPWMKDSRYLNPLLAAYDARLAAALAETAGRAQAAKDIQAQVNALVSENEALHDQLAKAMARLAGSAAADRAAAAAATDADKARMQERLELLETENDLLLAQQGELEEEIQRLGKLLQDKDTQLAQLQVAAAAAAADAASLRAQLSNVEHNSAGNRELKEKVKDLAAQLAAESSGAAAALAAADTAAAAQAALQRELAAGQAAGRSIHTLQADLARARSSADAAAADAAALRVEADGLRKALRAMESRLAEYQAKDTEVYLRIKAAMELAEEARLERDAAHSTTAALQQQLEATQARLADATRQLLGGAAADGGLGAAELRPRLAAAEREAARANKALAEAEAKVAELQATSARLARDKASLAAELTTLRDELGCCGCGGGDSRSSRSPLQSPMGTPGRLRAEMLSERLLDAERQREDVMQKLDIHKRTSARAEKDWELQRNTLHAEVQRLTRKVTEAEAAAAAAAATAAESHQAAAAAEAELQTLRGAAARVEAELRAQLADSRAARDAEVSGLAAKLERALAACDKAVSDAEQMTQGKDALLAEWKKEAQLMSSKLDAVLQQQAAERQELQEQLHSLTQQLADTQDQVDHLQQELDGAHAACVEGDLLLQEAEARLAAAQTAAATNQDQALQEVSELQGQLERAHMEKLKAQRQRDGLAAKLQRLVGPTGYTAVFAEARQQAAPALTGAERTGAAPSREGLYEGISSSADSSPAKMAAAATAMRVLQQGRGWAVQQQQGDGVQQGPGDGAAHEHQQ